MFRKKSPAHQTLAPISALIVALLCVSGCNLFGGIDKPGTDAQYLSAARACFDAGDFACAREAYGKLSSSYSDTVAAEESFITLDQQGASMAAYMEFVGNLIDRGTGPAMTAFANRLTSVAGVTTRVAIWNIYQQAATGAIQNSDMKNFVLFISSLALAAEILAEGAEGTSQLLPTDIASSSCQSASNVCGLGSASCAAPAAATLVMGTSNITTSSAPSNTQPTTRQLYDAIYNSYAAMQALGASGRFASAVTSFGNITSILGSNSALIGTSNTTDECFRQNLLTLGIGTL